MKRLFLLSAGLILLATIITGYIMWNKSHKEVKEASAVSVTAEALYSNFITDSAGARTSYTDKVVLVSGKINHVSQNQQGQQVVLINTTLASAFINCTMEEKSENLKAGDDVSIKGICSGYISGDSDLGLPGDVFLTRGYLINRK